jgi:hypothetical protein
MTRLVSLFAAFLGLVTLQTPAFALSYDASVFLSLSSPGGPFGTSLTFSPGATHIPVPVTYGSVSATSSAAASTPGQIQAATSGASFVFGEGYPIVISKATAVGLGSIRVNRDFAFFPLHIHEMWSVSGIGHHGNASIDLKVLLDGVLIHSRSASVAGEWPDVQRDLAEDVTTKLFLPLPLGVHGLVFTADAAGTIVTPEPASLILFGSTAAGLGWLARRRRKEPRVS